MNRRLQFVIIICTVALSTAIISHGMIAWLKIETSFGSYWRIGPERSKQSVFMAGSSLAGDGLSWRRISDELSLRIEGWGVAGSSPCEWEQFQHLATQTKLTILVVSPYDLNEYFSSDFRADVVPLRQTINDLLESRADWSFWKRVLSQYPRKYLRIIYPTAGRSVGVMAGVREELTKAVQVVIPIQSEAGPTLSFTENASTQDYHRERISNWSSGRMLRRLAEMRGASQGKHAFSGPKKLAFLRMLRQAQAQYGAVVVVLPVSPAYANEFLTREVKHEFEETLTEVRHSMPEVNWVRLDQVNELSSNEYFWDLVHMNPDGQNIATEVFLRQFVELTNLQ